MEAPFCLMRVAIAPSKWGPAVPIIRSRGGGGGICAVPPGVSDEGGSPVLSVLSVNPEGPLSRRRIPIVLVNFCAGEVKEMKTKCLCEAQNTYTHMKYLEQASL